MSNRVLDICIATFLFLIACNSAPKDKEQTQKSNRSVVEETPTFYSDTLPLVLKVDSLTLNEKLDLFKQILPKARRMDDYSTFSSTESVHIFQSVLNLMQTYQDSSEMRRNKLQSIYKKLLETSKEEFEANPIDIKTKLELAGIKSEINEIIARSKQNSITLELKDTVSK
jgi:hypothetical protein